MKTKCRAFVFTLATLICSLALLPQVQGQTHWWNDAVFYEVFVRSFYDSNGDGIGDLQGLIKKLDYLNDGNPSTTSDLGVAGIWLMPIFLSPSYHGYDVTNYKDINQDYGTLQVFQALIDSAHARGIRVVIDFVMNHTSSQHTWFVQSSSSPTSPFRDWYVWRSTDPGDIGPWGQKVWYLNNGAYYFALFWSGMPDLNYSNTLVKSTMFEASKFWLDTMRVDGFRLDAAKHIFEDGPVMENVPATFTFLRDFRQFTKGVKSDMMTVGEVWSPTAQVAPYVDGTGLDFCFEFQLASTIIDAVKTGQPGEVDAQMQTVVRSYPPLQYATFLTNHDQDRVFAQLSQDSGKMKLAAALYLTLPGVPFVYYGEEIGMTGAGVDENKRTPMQWNDSVYAGFTTGVPWRPVNSGFAQVNVRTMQSDSLSLWSWYRKLISARNANVSLRTGDYASMSTPNIGLYAFARRTSGEVAFVLHNFTSTAMSNTVLSLDSSSLKAGVYTVADVLSGDSIGTVTLNSLGGFSGWEGNSVVPPLGSVVLKVDTIRMIPTSVADNEGNARVEEYRLSQNYPNPFNPTTKIQFTIVDRQLTIIKVYDVLGRDVATLVNEVKEPGTYTVEFDARLSGGQGSSLTSGVFFYRLQAGDFVQTRKFLLLR
jgi:glycosidase